MMDESEMTTEERSWLFSEDADVGTVDIGAKVESPFPPHVADVPVDIKPETKPDLKSESVAEADVKDLFSGSTPPPDIPHSRSTSPNVKDEGRRSSGTRMKEEEDVKPTGPIIIDDLPTAWDEAHETFVTLEKCVYERKDMGQSKESDEMMVCDCSFDKRESFYLVITPCRSQSVCL